MFISSSADVNNLLDSYYAKLKKMEEEREKELAMKYRDRVSNIHSVL